MLPYLGLSAMPWRGALTNAALRLAELRIPHSPWSFLSWLFLGCFLALLVCLMANSPLHGRFDYHVTIDEKTSHPHPPTGADIRTSLVPVGPVKGAPINQTSYLARVLLEHVLVPIRKYSYTSRSPDSLFNPLSKR